MAGMGPGLRQLLRYVGGLCGKKSDRRPRYCAEYRCPGSGPGVVPVSGEHRDFYQAAFGGRAAEPTAQAGKRFTRTGGKTGGRGREGAATSESIPSCGVKRRSRQGHRLPDRNRERVPPCRSKPIPAPTSERIITLWWIPLRKEKCCMACIRSGPPCLPKKGGFTVSLPCLPASRIRGRKRLLRRPAAAASPWKRGIGPTLKKWREPRSTRGLPPGSALIH